MRKLQTGLTAVILAAAVSVTGITPLSAAPLVRLKAAQAQSDVIHVRDGWYRGYRGYRGYRPGYRYNDGWWFPAGAFVAGALIGGAIANGNNYYGNAYYGGGYYPRYYQPRYYAPRYYETAPAYYPPAGSSYRAGYRDGYRDGYYARPYGSDITCTERLQAAGNC